MQEITLSYNELLKELKLNTKVTCCLDGQSEKDYWFTGKVYHILNIDYYPEIHILRDDGSTGGGIDNTWRTVISQQNCHCIKILNNDWDD